MGNFNEDNLEQFFKNIVKNINTLNKDWKLRIPEIEYSVKGFMRHEVFLRNLQDFDLTIKVSGQSQIVLDGEYTEHFLYKPKKFKFTEYVLSPNEVCDVLIEFTLEEIAYNVIKNSTK